MFWSTRMKHSLLDVCPPEKFTYTVSRLMYSLRAEIIDQNWEIKGIHISLSN